MTVDAKAKTAVKVFDASGGACYNAFRRFDGLPI